MTHSLLLPLIRWKSIKMTCPPGRRASWMDCRVRCGYSKWWYVSQMNTRSTEPLGSLVENWSHRTVSTFVSLPSRQVFSMWRRKAGAMSTAKTFPLVPTAAANLRVNSPVPAPTSATASPGLSLQAATMAPAWAAISRLSPSNLSMNSLRSGFSNGLLIPGRTLFSWAAAGSGAGTQTTRPATTGEKKALMGCPFGRFPSGSGPSQITRVGLQGDLCRPWRCPSGAGLSPGHFIPAARPRRATATARSRPGPGNARRLRGRAASGPGAGQPHRGSDYNGPGRVPGPPAGRPAGQAQGPGRRPSMKGFLVLLFSGIAVADEGDAPQDQPALFKVTTRRKDDRVAVRADKDKALFTVTSPSGISQAVIERQE